MFFTITFAWFVGAVVRKTDFKTRLKIQQFNRNKIRRFFPPVSEAVKHSVVREKAEEEGGDGSPSNFSLRLPIGETFSREATAAPGA
jgi:hypothetical protein